MTGMIGVYDRDGNRVALVDTKSDLVEVSGFTFRIEARELEAHWSGAYIRTVRGVYRASDGYTFMRLLKWVGQ